MAGNAADALVIPVGLAFDLAYERRPDIELHKAFDGSHPTLLGTYLAAATTFAALYDVSAVGNPYDYYGAMPAEDAAFLQQVRRGRRRTVPRALGWPAVTQADAIPPGTPIWRAEARAEPNRSRGSIGGFPQ